MVVITICMAAMYIILAAVIFGFPIFVNFQITFKSKKIKYLFVLFIDFFSFSSIEVYLSILFIFFSNKSNSVVSIVTRIFIAVYFFSIKKKR